MRILIADNNVELCQVLQQFFALHDDLEVVVFEMSARSDGGTNTFMNGSAYSYLYYGEPLSMGRRMAMEIKNGIAEDRLDEIIT